MDLVRSNDVKVYNTQPGVNYGRENKNVEVDCTGTVRDRTGHVVGKVQEFGHVVDTNGKKIGRTK